MKKIWLKFVKDYKDPEGKEFKKDVIIEVDEAVGNALITMKYAEKTEAPKAEELLQQTLEKTTTQLTKSIEELVVKSIETATGAIDKRVKSIVNITKEETPLEKYDHSFKCEADFMDAVLKSSRSPRDIDERFTKVPSGVNTLDDTEGGFLVPDTIENAIWSNIQEDDFSLMSRTDQRQTSGNNLKFLTTRETKRDAGYRHMGMAAYWTEEAGVFTASQPTWSKFGLDLHKITALAYITQEELDDARVSVAPIVSTMAAKAIMFLVNESFLWGTGVGKPTGIMMADTLLTVEKETGQANGTITHKNISKMYHKLPVYLRQGAVWLVHPNLEEQLEFLTFLDASVSQNPIPIYFAPGVGMNGLTGNSNFGTLKGLPVIPCEYCKDLGNKGDIVLANCSQYISLTKSNGGIKQASSMHVRFLYEEMAYRWSFRVGGGTPWAAPKEDYQGTTLRGPFITLNDRQTTPGSSGL